MPTWLLDRHVPRLVSACAAFFTRCALKLLTPTAFVSLCSTQSASPSKYASLLNALNAKPGLQNG
jgi:hypothetical protein